MLCSLGNFTTRQQLYRNHVDVLHAGIQIHMKRRSLEPVRSPMFGALCRSIRRNSRRKIQNTAHLLPSLHQGSLQANL